MPLEVGATLSGEIVKVSPDGVLVSLLEGQIGLVPVSDYLSLETMHAQLHPGTHVMVKVVGQGKGDRFTLSILSLQEEKSSDAFDREFHRLNHVLTNRSSKVTLAGTQRDRLVEERIEDWVGQVEVGLSRIRKHRGKRLSEEFYDKEMDGGLHGKRAAHH
jgi:predicted RNA-binding protein with RPS1 domain